MHYDVIVIGGGSAGSALAGRLSEDPATNVLLIEAGPDYAPGSEPADIRDTYYTSFFRAQNFWPDLRVHFRPTNDPSPATGRRYEQARLIGGGSSINAMIALRGMPGDFDEWVAAGAEGWSWEDVLPYYLRLENDLDCDGPLHAKGGPITIRRHRRTQWPGFCQAIAMAAESRGWQFVADMNGEVKNGYCAVPISSTPNQRASAAMGYLNAEARRRSNLRILGDSFVQGLILEGRRAVGVRVTQGGRTEEFRGGEIVVSSGSLHSPAILQRAGIGPAEMLRGLGIEVVADRPGVGANLQDHPSVSVASHLKRSGRQPASLRPAPNIALRYDSGVPDCAASDMYVSVTNKTSWHPLGSAIAALVLCLYKPYSRGRVTLASSDPRAEPQVEFNLLSDPRDMTRLADGVLLAAEIYQHPAVRAVVNEVFPSSFSERVRSLNAYSNFNYLRSSTAHLLLEGPAALRGWLLRTLISPGADIGTLKTARDQLTDWIKARATPFYHPVGTCRMGAANDRHAVVDGLGRVHGIDNLRVADASVMPTIPRAATNISSIMIGEKMAAHIKAR